MKSGVNKKAMLLNDETERIKGRENKSGAKSLDGSPITIKSMAIPTVGHVPVKAEKAKPQPKPKPKRRAQQSRGVLTQAPPVLDIAEILRRAQLQQAMGSGMMGPALGQLLMNRRR